MGGHGCPPRVGRLPPRATDIPLRLEVRSIPRSRRTELLLLLFVAALVALGELLVLGMGYPPWRFIRGLASSGR